MARSCTGTRAAHDRSERTARFHRLRCRRLERPRSGQGLQQRELPRGVQRRHRHGDGAGHLEGLYESTLAQVGDGTITRRALTTPCGGSCGSRSVRPVRSRAAFDAPAGRQELLGAAEHRALARRAVRESLVLLKNQGGVLPLSPNRACWWPATARTTRPAGRRLDAELAGHRHQTRISRNLDLRRHLPPSPRPAASRLAVDGRFTQRPDVAIVVFGESPYAEFIGDIAHLQYGSDNGADWI